MTTDLLPRYPEAVEERDRWILQQRGPRASVQTDRPYAFQVEQEPFADGTVGAVATIFLTNRECPWRCVMCDLWRNTTTKPVNIGDIPRQISYALERLPAARQVKLYNSGSFFDRGAIPAADYGPIAALLGRFERVIVECHPALVNESCRRFQDSLGVQLEVAMGLETAHPEVLLKLNKRVTLTQFAEAAAKLRQESIALRSFVLLQPPFLPREQALPWACRSLDFAQELGAGVVAIIPTRGGNGAMETLAGLGEFTPPGIRDMEACLDYGLGRGQGRVLMDLWDFERVAGCPACQRARGERLQRMNLSQHIEPRVRCSLCDEPS